MTVFFDNTLNSNEGWAIFNCNGSADGPWQLQKKDDADQFECDADAWLFVWKFSSEGSTHHLKTLQFLKQHNPTEYDAIVSHFLRRVLTPI